MPAALVISALILAGAIVERSDARAGCWVAAAILAVMTWFVAAFGVHRR